MIQAVWPAQILPLLRRALPRPVRRRAHMLAWRCRRTIWGALNLQWRLHSGLTIQVRCESDWVIYNDLFVNREYDAAIEMVVRTRAGDGPLTILDLGANVGFFTLRLVDLLRQSGDSRPFRVTLVEGSGKVVGDLERRLKANGLKEEVRVVHGLVGQRSGYGRITEQEFNAMNRVCTEEGAAGARVPYIDLHRLFPDGSRIDLLKCDIEGSEALFLEHYAELMQRVEVAVFELHHDRCDAHRCLRALRELGFVHQQCLREEKSIAIWHFWRGGRGEAGAGDTQRGPGGGGA